MFEIFLGRRDVVDIGPSSVSAEEAIAMQDVSPASTDHDDQADHHHRRHHGCDVDVLYRHVLALTTLGLSHPVRSLAAVPAGVLFGHSFKLQYSCV